TGRNELRRYGSTFCDRTAGYPLTEDGVVERRGVQPVISTGVERSLPCQAMVCGMTTVYAVGGDLSAPLRYRFVVVEMTGEQSCLGIRTARRSGRQGWHAHVRSPRTR